MRKLIALAALPLLALASCAAEAPAPFPTTTPLPGEPLSQERYEHLDPILQRANPRLVTHPRGQKEIWWDRDLALTIEIRGEMPYCLPKSYDPEMYPKIAKRNPCRGMPDSIWLGPASGSGPARPPN